MRHIYAKSRGFTVPELLVVMVVSVILLTGIVTLVTNLFSIGGTTLTSAQQVRDAQSAVASIRNDLSISNSFLVAPTVADSDSGTSPSGSWRFEGNGENARILILKTAASTAYRADANRVLVYRQAGGCPIGKQVVSNNIIYFLKNNTLYRRTLVEVPTGTYCTGQTQAQTQTCSTPGGSGAPSNCANKDVIVANNITKFNVVYYTYANDASPDSAAYVSGATQSAIDLKASIGLTITATNTVDGQSSDYTSQVRLTRANYAN